MQQTALAPPQSAVLVQASADRSWPDVDGVQEAAHVYVVPCDDE